ncbi:uncharacterized protein LOC127420293 [Myxocyprinus asiaticus]|uniref:uncharacterized protein LOC127420293 n=1 Tax=Myxocyprinus asiaticus TaxID=70543 RepID=UPI002222E357|nr:uncharacterized protein LOC127420293 [Myxocyprinus asiaticus]
MKMHTYCVLIHVFVALLLCDYGMFSTPSSSSSSSSSSEESTTATSIISTITALIAESTTVRNDSTGTITEQTTNIQTEDSNDDDNEYSEEGSATITTTGNFLPPFHSTGRPESTPHHVHVNKFNPKISKDNSGQYTGGIIILIFILILIIILLGILYFLRKKGRSYSFDLTRASGPSNDYDTPLRSVEQQGASYEQTNKDLPVCLDYIQEDKSEEKTSPIANGCTGEKTEQTPASENEQQNVPEENSFSSSPSFTPPMKKVEFNLDLDLDLIGRESEMNSSTTVHSSDAVQNENNNNVTNAGRGAAEELFTEINLDEPREHA